jgi:NTE family protein
MLDGPRLRLASWLERLPIPFAAVATDIESGEAVDLDRGSLPLALRASVSLPGIFRPVSIGGRLLVDGAIVRNLPNAEARAPGADIVICSDVSEPPVAAADLRSFLDVMLQTLSFQMEASTLEQRRLCDVLIQADIKGLSPAAFDRAADWIAPGRRPRASGWPS